MVFSPFSLSPTKDSKSEVSPLGLLLPTGSYTSTDMYPIVLSEL